MPEPDSRKDDKLVAFQPALLATLFALCMVAFYLAQPSVGQILVILISVLGGLVFYCGIIFDAERHVRDDSKPQQSGLRISAHSSSAMQIIALKVAPGIVFFSGLIWLAIPFWTVENLSPTAADAAVFGWFIIKAAFLSCLIVLGGMVAAAMGGVMMLGGMTEISRTELVEADVRVRTFQEMLFVGILKSIFSPLEYEQKHQH